jgi:soluble lytic murein transglycosylase
MVVSLWAKRGLIAAGAVTVAAGLGALAHIAMPHNGEVVAAPAAVARIAEIKEVAPEGPALPTMPALSTKPVVATTVALLTPQDLRSANPTEVDDTATGSIPTVDALEDMPEHSAAFKAALKLVTDKDYEAAYEAAEKLPDAAERLTVEWAVLTYGGAAIGYERIAAFGKEAPELSDTPGFRMRLEQAFLRTKPDAKALVETFGKGMPRTFEGKIALALAHVELGQREQAENIAKTVWTEDFLDKATEDRFYKKLGELLTPEMHWDRAVHLMMHDRATAVERLLRFMTPAQKSLATARIAVSRNANDAKALLDRVDPTLKKHPVYLFSRAQRARQFELWDDAVNWLGKGKGDVPEAGEWWYERRTVTRKLLTMDDPKAAYEVAAGLTHGPDGRLVEANFHAGWIALSFLKDAEKAAGHFEEMRKHATLPDTVSQANYWLGRSLQAKGDKLGANDAFALAARSATAYYGLLARAELGLKGAQLRDLPDWQTRLDAFEKRDPVKVVRLLASAGETGMANNLLNAFTGTLTDGGELALAAQLADTIGSHNLSLQIAETAERRGIPLDVFGFPEKGLPPIRVASIDKAAVYAVTRQESAFQVKAKSSSGALGLMQLMPATAKETAGKVGVAYSKDKLTSDPSYNVLLGSTYLKAQLSYYDGSLVLAAAAYNAGAGNANKWIKAYGDPRDPDVDPVVWIELIPFQETRRYVQRVFGNYMVYRARFGAEDISAKDALRQIPG